MFFKDQRVIHLAIFLDFSTVLAGLQSSYSSSYRITTYKLIKGIGGLDKKSEAPSKKLKWEMTHFAFPWKTIVLAPVPVGSWADRRADFRSGVWARFPVSSLYVLGLISVWKLK